MIPLLVVGTISFLHLAILFDPFLKRTESISARLMHTIYQYLLGFASMNFKKPVSLLAKVNAHKVWALSWIMNFWNIVGEIDIAKAIR